MVSTTTAAPLTHTRCHTHWHDGEAGADTGAGSGLGQRPTLAGTESGAARSCKKETAVRSETHRLTIAVGDSLNIPETERENNCGRCRPSLLRTLTRTAETIYIYIHIHIHIYIYMYTSM